MSCRFPNVYGIDMPSRQELVAHGKSTEEIAQAIGADLVIFQSLPDLVSACRQFNPKIEKFDCSVFNGEYITGGVDEAYMAHLEGLRSDNIKGKELMEQGNGYNSFMNSPVVLPNGLPGPSLKRPGMSRASSEGGSVVGMENETKVSGPALDDTVGLHNTWNRDR
jgi:amidophosphoribosyltransferase